MERVLEPCTVKPGNSKLVNSKQRVNSKLFLAAFQSVYNINHLLNNKLLAIVNLLLFLKRLLLPGSTVLHTYHTLLTLFEMTLYGHIVL